MEKIKNFLSSRTSEDWIIYSVLGILILGISFFVIGFFWGIKINENFIPENNANIIFPSSNVKNILQGDWGQIPAYEQLNTKNLFTLMGSLEPNYGSLYSMTALSITGFSFIMISILAIIFIFLGTFLFSFIIAFFKKNKN
ncbi:MAG: hypothetical protein TYPL_0150 [Candidatus Tyloplasma litorale]|nr:MAG: hypothetical protein TYPL_0150 [Mycoplasmatales bacterium]